MGGETLDDTTLRESVGSGMDQVVARPLPPEFLDALLRPYKR